MINLAWGGYSIGRIPTSALGLIPGTNFYIKKTLLPGLNGLRAAFKAHFGKTLNITSAYRNYAEQSRLYAGWVNRLPGYSFAASPNSSLHEWALSIDFGSGVATWGSPEKLWMDKNAPLYGFIPTGNKFAVPEPWHFDGIGTATASLDITPIKQEEELDMTDIKYYWKEEKGTEYGIMGRDLPGGWEASDQEADGQAYGILFGTPEGAPWDKLPYNKWVAAQKLAKRLSAERVAELTAIAKAAAGTGGGMPSGIAELGPKSLAVLKDLNATTVKAIPRTFTAE